MTNDVIGRARSIRHLRVSDARTILSLYYARISCSLWKLSKSSKWCSLTMWVPSYSSLNVCLFAIWSQHAVWVKCLLKLLMHNIDRLESYEVFKLVWFAKKALFERKRLVTELFGLLYVHVTVWVCCMIEIVSDIWKFVNSMTLTYRRIATTAKWVEVHCCTISNSYHVLSLLHDGVTSWKHNNYTISVKS